MKLLLASSSFKGGGISTYAQELVACYTGSYEVSVLIGDDSLCPLENEYVKVYHYEMSDISVNNAQKVLDLINNVIKPDVLINSSAKLLTLLMPFIADNIKVVNVSHSLMYDEADYAGMNSLYADVVIALSGYAKKHLDAKYHIAQTDKVRVVPNFVRELENQDYLLKEKLANPIPTIVFTGGGTASKAPEIVFDIAYRLLKTDLNFKFYWLGVTTPPFKKILPLKEIKDILPNDPRLVFTGRIPRTEAMRISSNANIFLTPSRREGCPMALLEAMRVGVIPITSNYNNGCKEIIRDHINGFVIDKKNIKGFVDRIVDIIKKPENYVEIYARSYETFQKELSFYVWKEKMDGIILHKGNNHLARLDSFDTNLFNRFRRKQNIQSKLNLMHILCFEYLPSALPFYKYYLRFKREYR